MFWPKQAEQLNEILLLFMYSSGSGLLLFTHRSQHMYLLLLATPFKMINIGNDINIGYDHQGLSLPLWPWHGGRSKDGFHFRNRFIIFFYSSHPLFPTLPPVLALRLSLRGPVGRPDRLQFRLVRLGLMGQVRDLVLLLRHPLWPVLQLATHLSRCRGRH